ncbi:MAG TPA: LON peptidase substrate-binding domain-containing protein [Gemmatimonadaceae bacterium]|nr:LON peptidase substrate-binding domain-containing protein [Gemmatimonadaceae bacterium]
MITTPIPLFPLGLVLMPGASVPLHLFEPRYRAMLQDVNGTSRRFGLVAPPPDTAEEHLPAGRIGCIARITSVEMMPGGRANITVEGAERFRFERYVSSATPYRMADVTEYEDTPEDPLLLAAAADRVRELAMRAVRASMTIHDVDSDAPTLDADAAVMSFQVAHMLRVGNDVLYDLLARRSTVARLMRLDAAIRSGLQDIEGAAELHVRAKTNGHHHGPPPG